MLRFVQRKKGGKKLTGLDQKKILAELLKISAKSRFDYLKVKRKLRLEEIRFKLQEYIQKDPYLRIYKKSPPIEIRMVLWVQKKVKVAQNSNAFVRLPLAIFLILLGFIGVFVPILPGLSFIIPGVLLISPSFSEKIEQWVDKYIDWRQKFFARKK